MWVDSMQMLHVLCKGVGHLWILVTGCPQNQFLDSHQEMDDYPKLCMPSTVERSSACSNFGPFQSELLQALLTPLLASPCRVFTTEIAGLGMCVLFLNCPFSLHVVGIL